MSVPYSSPVKRSITIAGHPTSVSLEPVFWSALVARIDAERIAAPDPSNLASAIRVWLFTRAQG